MLMCSLWVVVLVVLGRQLLVFRPSLTILLSGSLAPPCRLLLLLRGSLSCIGSAPFPFFALPLPEPFPVADCALGPLPRIARLYLLFFRDV